VTPYDMIPDTYYRGDASDLEKRKRIYEEIVRYIEIHGGNNNHAKEQPNMQNHEELSISSEQIDGDIGRPRAQYRNEMMREVVLTLYYQGGKLDPVSKLVAKSYHNYKSNYKNVPDKFRRYLKREILDDFMDAVSKSDVHEAVALAALMPKDYQKKVGVTCFKF
jgi:hypothetical protein